MSYDVAIIGAGPAGTTAAILLAARGLKPVVIERAKRPGRSEPRPEWLSLAGINLLKTCGADCAAMLGSPFGGMSFHSADLKKTAVSASANPPGYRIDYSRLTELMQRTYTDAGGRIVYSACLKRVEAGEKRVRLELQEGDPIESTFLLLADGADRTFAPAGLGQAQPLVAPPPASTQGRWYATLELESAGKAREAKGVVDAHMHWLVGLDRRQGCLLWWWEESTAVLSLLATGAGTDVAGLLCSNAARLVEAGLLKHREPIRPDAVRLRPAPMRSALEIESHVEKRLLLVGDAGGFISETSGEGIYAAAWSAQLAVDAMTAALGSTHPQDQLRQFSTMWRSTMAEYLRPPNTDVHFLLPLIFSNKQMADRMAAAFWDGTNI